MQLLRSALGELRWTPPAWIGRIGLRRLIVGLGASALIIVAAIFAFRYYDSLPKPPRIVAQVNAPGITPIVDDRLRPQSLTIDFSIRSDPRVPVATAKSVARIDLIGKVISEGISMQPATPGEWRWDNQNRLSFTPSQDWPAGQRYLVRFDAALFTANQTLDDDHAEFTTPAFSVAIDELSFYQDPVDHSLHKVVSTLSFTHPVNEESLQRHLSFSTRKSGATIDTNPRPVGYEISYDDHRRVAYVHSVPIDIPPEENYLTLVLDKGLAPSNGPSRVASVKRQNVLIPDIGSYFRVDQVQSIIARNEDDEPEQTITLAFTDRVGREALQGKVEVYHLPTRLTLDGVHVSNKYWQSAREVTDEVLAQSSPVDIKLNPVQDSISQLHSATIDMPENSYLYLKIDSGLLSDGEFVMSRPYEIIVRAQPYPKEATIAQSGAILPLSGNHKLTFVSRGVSTLKVDIGRLLDDQVNHLASQTAGDIKSPYFTNYHFGEDNMTARKSRFIDLNVAHPKKAAYSHLDLTEYLTDGGYFFITVQGWNRSNNVPVGTQDKRFVLITDLGLLVKSNADSTQDVFVQSISTGLPVPGAKVSLLGKNGLPIIDRSTSTDGHVSMPATKDFEHEKTPTVFVVHHGRDSVFMPYARGTRMLQYSRFDVGGDYVRFNSNVNQLRAQVFTDRGLYRPGDTAKLAAIVKNDNWEQLGNLPLAIHVLDPRGQTVFDQHIRLPDDGFFEQSFATEAASATGNYVATLFLIDEWKQRRAIGSVNFKVEEFLPDRLRIRSEISGHKPQGWIKPNELYCEVSLQNLFGTPAESRRVTGELELQPSRILFRQFPGFIFDDPLRESDSAVQPVRLSLAATTTDQQGLAKLPLDLSQYDKGIYRLSVFTEGFEDGGGRSVKAHASMMMSPLDYLIGYKTDGDLSFIDKASEHAVEFLAIDSDARSVPRDDLTLSIVEERYVSSLVQRPNGTFAYQSILKEQPVSTRDFAIKKEGGHFSLPTTQAGTFAVKVSDRDGLVYSKVRYIVAGARNLSGNLERDAELSLHLDGSNFKPGEQIEMEITAPYTGAGLITIEKDQVYAHKWFQSASNTSVQTIHVPKGLEGNAYVNVAFVRDIDSPEVFVSPLSYAVAPFSINRGARTIEVELDIPERVRPGEEMKVSYRTSRPSRVIVYAVDEGILQVAKYQTPNPLDFFLRKMALQVGTYQMVDLILPEFDAPQRSAAPGGGEAAGLAGKNLNPFRRKTEAPVVFWSGIVDSGPEPRSVSFTVPDYFNGELRFMAIAVADDAVGNYSDKTVARGPFVITPNLLTAAAPGDEFDVTVGLANNLEGSGEGAAISLTAWPSEHLEIVGDKQIELRIDEGREGRATFRVRAKNQLGSASLQFEAESGDEIARRRATVSVRPSVAYVATMTAGTADDDPLTLRFQRSLYDEFAEQSAAASASPLVLADGLLGYLDAFPHACAEQIVSKVFPQIGFLGNQDRAVDEQAIRTMFKHTITKLRSRQMPEGGFRFWATSREPADFASVYIMHFLTDAGDLTLPVPRDMLGSGLGFLQQLAGREASNMSDARLRAYAVYVLTRNSIVTTNYLTNLHEFLDRDYADEWHSDLTAAYMAASYELLKRSGLGRQLMDDYAMGAGDEMVSDFDTRLGRDAQYLYLLARHFPDQLSEIEPVAIQRLVEPVMKNRFNTLSSAYTILALGAYTRAVFEGQDAPMLSIAGGGDNNAVEILADAARFARAQVGNDTAEVQIRGSEGEQFYYVLTQTGFDNVPPAASAAEGIEIFREYLDDTENPVTAAQVGDELTVRLRVRSTGRTRTNVAVVDLLPGGFEVLTESIRDQYDHWYADYRDVREDRVIIYGAFNSRVTEIRYRVKLTSPGNFVVPAAYAGSMYDLSIQANTRPGRFEVNAIQ